MNIILTYNSIYITLCFFNQENQNIPNDFDKYFFQ